MGGSDPAGLTVKVMRALASYPIPAIINVVLGPAFEGEDPITQIVVESDNDFVIHQNVPSMAEMMLHADLAITAGGRMAYELAATGTPGIIVPSIEHELKVAEAFKQAGTCTSVDALDQGALLSLKHGVDTLLKDQVWRTKMSMRGQEIVDAKGRGRVVQHLVQE